MISAFELLSGARTSRERSKVEALLGAVKTVPLSEDACRTAAAIRLDLETKRVEVIGLDLDDAAIRAAIAEAGYEAA